MIYRSYLIVFLFFGSQCVFAEPSKAVLFDGILNRPIFSPVNNDLSMEFLYSIFGAVNSETINSPLGALLSIFNDAVLTFSLLLLIFYACTFTLNAAATGEFLTQKLNASLFVRIVIGLMLLWKLPSGFTLLQQGTFNLVKSGVGLADGIWDVANKQLSSLTNTMYSITTLETTVDTVWQGLICSYSYDYGATGGNFNSKTNSTGVDEAKKANDTFPDINEMTKKYALSLRPDSASLTKYDSNYRTSSWRGPYWYKDDKSICFGKINTTKDGSYYNNCTQAVNDNQSNLSRRTADIRICGQIKEVSEVQKGYFNQLIKELTPAALYVVENQEPYRYKFPFELPENKSGEIAKAIEKFIENMNSSVVLNAAVNQNARFGWITAALFYKSANSLFGPVSDNKSTASPSGFELTPPASDDAFASFSPNAKTNSKSPYVLAIDSIKLKTIAPSTISAQRTDYLASFRSFNTTIGDSTLGGLMHVGYSAKQSLELSIAESGNPFTNLVAAGNAMMDGAVAALAIQIIINILIVALSSICSCQTPGAQIAKAAANIGIILTTSLVGVLYMQGAVLAIVIPLIPIVIYIAGVMGWLFAVLEAIVAAPIVALGILWPSNSHEIWGKSEPALFILLNIFLRPSLMLLGFLLGLFMFWLSVYLLSVLVKAAYTFQIIEIDGLNSVTTFVIPIFYIMMLVTLCKKSFSLIFMLPERVLTWIGATAVSWGDSDSLVTSLDNGARQGVGMITMLAGILKGVGAANIQSAEDTDKLKKTAGS